MKKLSILFALLLCLCLCLFVACGDGEGDDTDTTEATVKITFDTAGGDALSSQTVSKGESITPPTPTRKGYSFDGWFVGDTPWDGKTINADTKVTAKWTLLTFEITYIVNGGENNALNVPVYTVEDGFALGEPTVFGEYNEFFGWILVLENEEKPIETIEKGTTGTLTLKADIRYQPFTFELKDDGTYAVTGVRDPEMTEGAIPERYKGKAVTSIAPQAFYENLNVTSIYIPDSITRIEDEAFSYSVSLTSVRMSSNIEYVGTAFEFCPELTFNEYDNAFYLGNEENPYAVLFQAKSIEITSCQIHEDTRVLRSLSFGSCYNLNEITIPASVISMGDFTFTTCMSLKKVTFEGDAITSIGDFAFSDCRELSSITLPSKLTHIGNRAFYGAGLYGITLPNTVKVLDEYSFANCTNLSSIKLSNSLEWVGDYSFANCSKKVNVTRKNGLAYLGSEENPYLLLLDLSNVAEPVENPFVIDENTKFIHTWAFMNAGATTVTIPDSVIFIGTEAFKGCGALSSVVIGEGVEYIGDSAFKDCDDLKSVKFTGAVKFMGYYVFENCNYIETVDFGDKMEYIGNAAFMGCWFIQEITIPDSVTYIGQKAFLSCVDLKKVTLGKGITEIQRDTFQNCYDLKEIVFSENIKIIGEASFSACSSLESVTLNDGVEEIHPLAFASCPALKTIKV